MLARLSFSVVVLCFLNGCGSDGPNTSSASNWLRCETDYDCLPLNGVCGSDNICVDASNQRILGCGEGHVEAEEGAERDCETGVCYDLADGTRCLEVLPSAEEGCILSGTMSTSDPSAADSLDLALLSVLDESTGTVVGEEQLNPAPTLPYDYCIQASDSLPEDGQFRVFVRFTSPDTTEGETPSSGELLFGYDAARYVNLPRGEYDIELVALE